MRITLSDRSPQDVDTPWFHGIESLLAGGGAGLVSSVVTCPLDVIKTKLQAGGSAGRGLTGTFTYIWTHDGFRGFYRGLGPTIIGYLPTWAIYFTVYDRVKTSVGARRGPDDPISHITAAMTAGASGTIVTNPLWVVKTRFMTQTPTPDNPRYAHTFDALYRIYRTEGVRTFYRGLVPSLMGVSHIVVQFPLYERFKIWQRPADGSDIPASTILLCSSVSKMVASVATYPHEVLRTRLQAQSSPRSRPPSTPTAPPAPAPPLNPLPPSSVPPVPTSTPSIPAPTTHMTNHRPYEGVTTTFKRILTEEGFKGFYRGMGVNLLRTVPSSALSILSYEILMRKLTALSRSRMMGA